MASLEQETATDARGGKELQWFLDTFRNTDTFLSEQRKLATIDYEWYHNFNDGQWSGPEKTQLRARGQPIVTSNRIKRKVNTDMGLEQRSKTDPRAFPRTPDDEQAAQIATDVLNYVETKTLFDNTASESFRDLLIGGIEAAEVVVDEDHEIEINLISFENFFFDPRSKKSNFSDANYLGYAQWFDLAEAQEIYSEKEQKEFLQDTFESSPIGGVGEDKPRFGLFGDHDRQRVRVVIIYYKDGLDWRYAHFTGSGVLIEGPSFYLDQEGKPASAIIAQSAFVTLDNERYGIVRDMLSPQREVNYRKSKSLNLSANQRMWASDEGVFPDQSAARLQASRADGILMANGQKDLNWGFIESSAEVAENLAFLQEAKQEIESQSPNAALQGRGVQNQSGIAIQAQQASGITEESNVFTNHHNWKVRVYRAIWSRVKQFWTEDRFIRVKDDESAFRFAHVNVIATPRNQIRMLPEEQQEEAFAALAERGIGRQDPQLDIPQMTVEQDPQTGQLVQKPAMFNALAEMDMDIIIEATPDNITMQHEEFDQLVAFAQGGVNIPARVMIQASQLPNKDKLLKAMDEEAAAQSEAQQPVAQLQLAGEQAGVEKTQAETGKVIADTAKSESETVLNQAKVMETVEDTAGKRASFGVG